ncbi:MAG: Abortive infection protein [Limisphaerales bacterium]|nr:MAG: Abortive infection protein [Limisphaerales bacterium]KAG0508693.1 MAG: Abortive infection protein [Limisphaerales bacterium]TXT50343.1 MAG: Abortive infection protein [Limisphaerales bacterium]
MLPERKWEAEPLLRFVAGVCFCLSIGALASSAVLPKAAFATQEGKFFLFVTNSLVLHGGTLLLVAVLLRQHGIGWCEGFGFRREGIVRTLGLALAGVLVALPVALALQQLSAMGMKSVSVQPEVQVVVQTLQETQTLQQRVFFAFVAILGAPVVEEILFRGILYPAVKQRGWPQMALWGTSLLFALTHANTATFLPLTFLAMVLVFLYERTGNLLAPILTHSLFNAANYCALVFQGELRQFFKLPS